MTVPQEWTDEVVRDHAAGIVFDGEEYEPECVLCQKAVGLGYFAHYGYEVDPSALNDGEAVGPHEHVYRCQDCGEIGRAPALPTAPRVGGSIEP